MHEQDTSKVCINIAKCMTLLDVCEAMNRVANTEWVVFMSGLRQERAQFELRVCVSAYVCARVRTSVCVAVGPIRVWVRVCARVYVRE